MFICQVNVNMFVQIMECNFRRTQCSSESLQKGATPVPPGVRWWMKKGCGWVVMKERKGKGKKCIYIAPLL